MYRPEPWLWHKQQPFPLASLISGQLTTPQEEHAENIYTIDAHSQELLVVYCIVDFVPRGP